MFTEVAHFIGGFMRQTARVLIAEDHRIMRNSLSRLIDSQDDFTVVGHAPNGAAAVELAHALKPDVVLMDYSMPQMDGVEATRKIVRSHPQIVVIGFSMHDEGPEEQALLEAGARAHISKSQSTADLLSILRQLAR